MRARPDVSIVIVNMNAVAMLRDCLASIRDTRGSVDVEIIVVDNGSSDGSIEAARREWPALVALPQGRSIGYVPSNNLGLRHASGRYVLFLNNDTLLRPGCLQELVHAADAEPRIGAISGQILNPDGSDQGTARRFPSIANAVFGRRSVLSRLFPTNPWTRRYMLGRQRRDEEPFEAEILSSACLMAPTGLLRELNGMDEDFHLYWVDAELCSRMRARGFKVVCAPRAKIVHFEGQGGSTRTFRQRWRSAIAFHQDAYHAYVKVRGLRPWRPHALTVAALLSARAAGLMLLQLLRPTRAVSSGGRNR